MYKVSYFVSRFDIPVINFLQFSESSSNKARTAFIHGCQQQQQQHRILSQRLLANMPDYSERKTA